MCSEWQAIAAVLGGVIIALSAVAITVAVYAAWALRDTLENAIPSWEERDDKES